jgi:Protein of unknown function (DUF2934)
MPAGWRLRRTSFTYFSFGGEAARAARPTTHRVKLRAVRFDPRLKKGAENPMKNQNPDFPEETEFSDTELLQRQIALCAYQLYEAKGCLDGFDLQDWLQAEREILGEIEQPQKAGAAGG